MPRWRSLEERFLERCLPDPNSGCVIWDQPGSASDYGYIDHDGKRYKAHRLAYEMEYGPISDGLVVHHEYRTPSCVNPRHLRALTMSAHSRGHKDAHEKGGNARRGRTPWNKGLRASEDARLAGLVARSAQTRTGMLGWSRGLPVASDERVSRGVKRRTGHKWPEEQKHARSELVKTYQRGPDGKYSGGRKCGA